VIGLLVAYGVGKDRGRKQVATPSDKSAVPFMAIPVFGMIGSVEGGATGAFVGIFIACTIYYVIGTVINRSVTQLVFGLTVIAGAWLGAWHGDWNWLGTGWGALWGASLFVGYLLHLLVWKRRRVPILVDPEDVDA
jgi:hypothetical protein